MKFLGLEVGSWGELLSAIGTISAVVVSLCLVRKPKNKLILNTSYSNDDKYVNVELTNDREKYFCYKFFNVTLVNLDMKTKFLHHMSNRCISNVERETKILKYGESNLIVTLDIELLDRLQGAFSINSSNFRVGLAIEIWVSGEKDTRHILVQDTGGGWQAAFTKKEIPFG